MSDGVISQWVKDKNGQLVGHLVAYVPNQTLVDIGWKDIVYVGYSFCDTRYDKFDKSVAKIMSDDKAIQLSLAKNVDKILSKVPYNYRADFEYFVRRVKRYYKGKKGSEWLEVYYGRL